MNVLVYGVFMKERSGKKISKKVGGEEVVFKPIAEGVASSPIRNDVVVERAEAVPAPEPVLAPIAKALRSAEFLELAEPKLPNLQKRQPRPAIDAVAESSVFLLVSRQESLSHAQPRTGRIDGLRPGPQTGQYQGPRLRRCTRWTEAVTGGSTSRPMVIIGLSWAFMPLTGRIFVFFIQNTVTTPRKSPSPRSAESAEWRVPAQRFARVLDAAGFARDAFDVALGRRRLECRGHCYTLGFCSV
jgi:hypothetical protein